MRENFFTYERNSEESWMSVSDLMAGLMVIFLFVAIAFIKGVGQEQELLEKSICEDIKKSLQEIEWRKQVEICSDEIVVKFRNPDALFDHGKANLKPEFREMLVEFFPRYMSVINKYEEEIHELRIEGHTDDTGTSGNELDNYFYNIGLSQDRTRSVMQFLFETQTARLNKDWLVSHMTANGLSYSHPVYKEGGQIMDRSKSRRVEFKIRLKTPKRLRDIAEVFAWK